VAAGVAGSRHLAALAGAERSAELELYASESALARALAESRRLAAGRLGLERSLARARTRSTVVGASLASSRRNIAALLRQLYVDGEAEPLAVLFGARSLEGVLEGIEVLERATSLNRRLAAEARDRAVRLDAELGRLTRARAALDLAEAQARRAAVSHVAAVAAKQSTLDSIRRTHGLTRDRLAAAEARARLAQRASVRIARDAARTSPPLAATSQLPAPTEPQPTPVDTRTAEAGLGGRQFVADAVAYHLPGRTASGLPVGVGVIAVDPTVIPLGTRVFVPGYGPAVAADVGSAIKGNIIDLWMPSTAAARAWGRRTVTITIYR
jgi:3D (Asp-Asp-Asp) domain-containing protein